MEAEEVIVIVVDKTLDEIDDCITESSIAEKPDDCVVEGE